MNSIVIVWNERVLLFSCTWGHTVIHTEPGESKTPCLTHMVRDEEDNTRLILPRSSCCTTESSNATHREPSCNYARLAPGFTWHQLTCGVVRSEGMKPTRGMLKGERPREPSVGLLQTSKCWKGTGDQTLKTTTTNNAKVLTGKFDFGPPLMFNVEFSLHGFQSGRVTVVFTLHDCLG